MQAERRSQNDGRYHHNRKQHCRLQSKFLWVFSIIIAQQAVSLQFYRRFIKIAPAFKFISPHMTQDICLDFPACRLYSADRYDQACILVFFSSGGPGGAAFSYGALTREKLSK
jgi:hypothetical protein